MAKTQAQCNLDDPKEMFAWMFAAGVPDPRAEAQGKPYRNQPLINPACFGALSQMLYDMGARFHPELQKVWVNPGQGPERNFQANGTTDIKPEDILPDVAGMTADQFPDVAERVAAVTPATHAAALQEQTDRLLDSLARLKAVRAQLDANSAPADAAPAGAPAPASAGESGGAS